jgi:acrylyl-CoA reductase (NADPH)
VGDASRALQREKWVFPADCVGGEMLAAVLACMRHSGAVAASGNTGGALLPTTVFPFILRGHSLLNLVLRSSCGVELDVPRVASWW